MQQRQNNHMVINTVVPSLLREVRIHTTGKITENHFPENRPTKAALKLIFRNLYQIYVYVITNSESNDAYFLSDPNG